MKGIYLINTIADQIADTEIVKNKHTIVNLKLDHFECDFSKDVFSIFYLPIINIAIIAPSNNNCKINVRLIIKEKNTIKGVLSVSDLLKHKNLSIYILDLLKEIYNIQSDVVLFKDISSDQSI